MPTLTGKGLEGVVATTSSICYIDGEQGVLAYRGYDIHDLAENSTFEEVCYLLWFGRLPSPAELRELQAQLRGESKLEAGFIAFLRQVPQHVEPMDMLRTAVSALSFFDPDAKANDAEANMRKSIRLTAQIAMIVAYYDRIARTGRWWNRILRYRTRETFSTCSMGRSPRRRRNGPWMSL